MPHYLVNEKIPVIDMLLRYLSHPQVQIDPNIPVPSWGLNEIGRDRVTALNVARWFDGVTQIISSAQTKAIETANMISAALDISVEIREGMHENDRTAPGFLPPHEFENVADQFFANPSKSVRGWERAIDAQARIVAEVECLIKSHQCGDILVIGHGAVGTLLLCHYSNAQISRQFDQPGSGNYFTLKIKNRQIQHHWLPMEEAPER